MLGISNLQPRVGRTAGHRAVSHRNTALMGWMSVYRPRPVRSDRLGVPGAVRFERAVHHLAQIVQLERFSDVARGAEPLGSLGNPAGGGHDDKWRDLAQRLP